MSSLLKADGFDDAILGVGLKKGSEDSIVYSYEKCVEILMDREDMTYEDAIEWMEFNVVDAYVGPTTPIFVHTDPEYLQSYTG
jgi:hypothetical protein